MAIVNQQSTVKQQQRAKMILPLLSVQPLCVFGFPVVINAAGNSKKKKKESVKKCSICGGGRC